MKKKILAAFLAAALVLSMSACGSEKTEDTNDDVTVTENDSNEVKEEKDEEPADDGVIDFKGETFKVTYTKHEIGTDWEGNPCLLYYFNFTNNGEEATSAMVTSYFQCFQNGIECESTFTDESNEAMDNYSKDIQPGVTLEVCEVFSLEDTSEVTIEASDWVSFSDKKDTQKITLE